MNVEIVVAGSENNQKDLFQRIARELGVVISTYDNWDVFVSDFCDFFYDYPRQKLTVIIEDYDSRTELVDEFTDVIREIKDFPEFDNRISVRFS